MRKLLNHYFFFNLYQLIIGSTNWHKRYAKNFIIPHIKDIPAPTILDFGCGTGNIIKQLPQNIEYTGIDYSKNYIDYDCKKFPKHTFICQSATEDINLNKTFNLIISEALISNFDDENVYLILKNILKHSNKDTKIVISEMNYKIGNSKIENYLLSHERGSHTRGKDEYIKLLSKYFKINNVAEIDNPYRIPYKKAVFECSPLL